jgi:hypothetical protein
MWIRCGVGTLLLAFITGCGQSSSPAAPSSSCSYAVSPTVQSVPSVGGTFTTTMMTASTCSWTAVTDVSWIAITSGSSGTRTGAITYSVPANSAVIRRGTIAAQVPGGASVTVTVIQDGVNQ